MRRRSYLSPERSIINAKNTVAVYVLLQVQAKTLHLETKNFELILVYFLIVKKGIMTCQRLFGGII